MRNGGSLALMPRTRRGLVLFWTAIVMLTLAFQYAAAAAPKGALATGNECDPFSIQTSDVNGGPVNENHYASKPEVYLQGGPDSGGDFLPGGTLVYYQVQEPNGTPLMPIRSIAVEDDGTFRVQLFPFATTSNPGGEYKVVASTDSELHDPGCTKSDNFKVDGPGSLKITKTIDGGPADFSGSFDIHVDCGLSGEFDRTIVFPDPGFVTISGIDALAECTVTETDTPNAPSGFEWGQVTYTGNPATIESEGTVNVGVVNHLNELPAPALAITKGVSLSADGPFEASLTTEIGTTVHYRITVTNTGNVELTEVTLEDSLTDLVAAGCEIPTTLAAGDHFDCDYSTTAVAGETVNTATADSEETGPEDDSATVTGTTTPGLQIRKGVSTNADGPFVNIVNVAPGTTVYYRITVTNTGNVDLTGVTLSDNTFDLVAKGCTIPTTLAVGASFDCDYSAVSAETSTINTATADSNETEPEDDSATVNPVTQQLTPVLGIDKSNNAPVPPSGAAEGGIVTYTLDYTITDGPADNATIKDVLPVGVTYVADSATDSENDEFVFDGYDSATRTLTWTAVQVSENGSVSYRVSVDEGAADIAQPLVNEACIVATGAAEVCDESDVFVAPPPLAETSVPTAPRTDVLGSSGTSTPGMNMGLVLAFLAIVTFALAFVTPMPATLRGKIRRR